MKIKITMIILLLLTVRYSVQSQQLITENFDYTTDSALTSNNWIQITPAATPQIKVANIGLTYSGYILSGIGKAARVDTAGQDAYRDLFNSVTTGSIYTSMMINVSKVTNAGDYFFAYLPQNSTSGYTGRLYARAAGTGFYKLGITKGSSNSETIVFSNDSFPLNTTSLLVIKYQYNIGNTNDSIMVYNFTSGFPTTEPSVATLATIGGTTADATSLGRIALRQGTAANAPRLLVDGIRSATNWVDLNAATRTATRAITNLLFTATGQTSARVSWVKPAGYVNANGTMVVYAKALSAITAGTPTTNPLLINADSNFNNFNGIGSALSIDANARCIYKGDSTFVNLAGLNAGTNYFIAAYAINDVDSNYSAVVNANGITASAGPINVKSVSVISLTSATAKVSWTKDTSYSNANFTTLVFLKQANAVTQGMPDINPTNYSANFAFGAGTKYQNDTNAFCIYKGDSTFVNTDNLNASTLYYALIYVVSDVDSLYSNPTTASGTTRGLPPTNVSGITLTGITTTSTKISWTKPSNYNNSTLTTLVFVKANTSITEGTPSRSVNTINANANFNSIVSSRYQNDTAAKCVYKGDTNFVNITSINNYTNYHVLIYVVRDADSTYSTNSATASGTASPNPPTPPSYTIAQIGNINTTTGVPDSINVRVALRGIVYSINQRTAMQGGLIFVLRDNTGGITVANTASTFGYTPVEGDSIQVFGVVSSLRGLLVLGNIDSLALLATGKTLTNPKLTTRLGENTENDLVRLNAVKFVNRPNGINWTAGQTYNIITANNDTAAIRIYNSSLLANTPFPTTTYFHVKGFGAQTSTSAVAPYAFNGYQILPRNANDIVPYNALTGFQVVTPGTNNNVTISGDTNQTMFTNWTKSILDPISSSVGPVLYTVSIDTLGGNFRNPIANLLSKTSGIDTLLNITFGRIRSILVSLGAQPNQTLSLKWRVNASAGPFVVSSDTIITNFTLGYGMGVQSQVAKTLVAYPNPCNENIFIQLPALLSNTATIEIVDLTGKVLVTKTIDNKQLNEVSVNTNSLTKGIYLLKLTADNDSFIQKIIKE
jgi:DNA/RNA endonuclease YhcR with UshA esterase domain